jgi:GLPGLI family protein
MKINYLIFFTISLIQNIYSQNIEVEYGVLFDIENIKEEKFKNSFFSKIINESKDKITYELIFNDSLSNFKIKEQLEIENFNKIRFAAGLIFEGEFVFNKKKDVLIKIISNYNLVILNRQIWKITDETKKIDGFTCYKATTEKIVINSKGKFVFPVTVWFTPELPFSFGPGNYFDLPGLILEIQERNFVVFAKKINLNSNKKINDILNSNLISEDEYIKKIQETRKKN